MSGPGRSGRGPAYRDLVELGAGLMWAQDLDGVVTWVNAALASLLGYERAELPGRSLADLLVDPADLEASLARLRSGEEDRRAVEARARDGTTRSLRLHCRAVTPDGGEPYVLGHALDVTERRERETDPSGAKPAGMSRAQEGRRAGEPETATRHPMREAGRTLNVLLAEDNPVNQQLAVHLLGHFGHSVRVAHTGAEALELLEREAFDVILMDIQMPELDGLQATREIRRREAEGGAGRRVPIVAMTAHAMAGDRERFLASGMDEYISKPISRDRLRDVLRAIEPEGPTPPVASAAEAGSGSPTPALPLGSDVRADAEDAGPEGPSPRLAFDPELLFERTESDTELIRTLVIVFGSDQARLLSDLESAVMRGDGAAVERIAHTLKGAVSVFGAERACVLSERMERLGRHGTLEAAREGYARLRAEVLALEADLTALTQRLEGSSTPP